MKDSGKPSGFSRLLSVCLSVSHRVSVSHQNSTQLPSPNDNRLRIVTQKAFWMLSATNTTSISSQSYSYYYTINDLTRVGDLWLFYCPCNLYPYLINFSSILLCSALLTLPLCSAHSSTLLCSRLLNTPRVVTSGSRRDVPEKCALQCHYITATLSLHYRYSLRTNPA